MDGVVTLLSKNGTIDVGDAHRRESSRQCQTHTLRWQHLTGTLKAGEDIVPLKIGKLSEHTFDGIAPPCQIFKDTLNLIAQTTIRGLP